MSKASRKPPQAASSPVEASLLAAFEPLGRLPEGLQQRIASVSRLVTLSGGELLFRQGERDGEVYYLHRGSLQLENEQGPSRRLEAGTDGARLRLADLQPRMLSARAVGDAVVLAIPREEYERALAEERAREEPPAGGEEDWMLRLLQSELFLHLPPAGIQRIFTALQPRTMSRGECLSEAGEPVAGFSFLLTGRCRIQPEGGSGVDLGPGDWFGEEALVESGRAHSTVIVLEEGERMFLPGAVFRELVAEPLLQRIPFEVASRRVATGKGPWVDVRRPDEYQGNGLEESVNLPLARMREVLAGLSPERSYTLYCDDGRRSTIGAFLLAARGIDAVCVDGGMPLRAVLRETGSSPLLRQFREELGELRKALGQVLDERDGVHRAVTAEQARLREELEAMRSTLQENRTLHLQVAELRQEVAEQLAALRRDQASWQQRLEEHARSRLKKMSLQEQGVLERYRGEQEQQLEQLQETCRGLREELDEQRRRNAAIERLAETLGRLEQEAGRQQEMTRALEAQWRQRLTSTLEQERARLGQLLEQRLEELAVRQNDPDELAGLAREVALQETRRLLAEYEASRREQYQQDQEQLRRQRRQLEQDAGRIRETLEAVEKIRGEARRTLASATAEIEALRRSREEASRHGGGEEIERIDRELRRINHKVAEASGRLRMSEGLRSEADAALQANREELDRQARKEAALQARLHRELEEWLREQKELVTGSSAENEQQMRKLLRHSRQLVARRKAHDQRLQEELHEQLGKAN